MSATECHQHTSDSSTDSRWLCSSDLLCMLWTLADLKLNPAVHCSPRSEDQIYQRWHETSVFGDSSTILSSADPLNFGFLKSGFLDCSVYGCLPDHSQSVVNLFSCRRQYFAKLREKQPVTVWEMLINLLTCNAEGSGKLIPNPYLGPDHPQMLINVAICRPSDES